MLYLLDANVLITANNSYYPIRRVPEFWGWLVNCGTQGQVKIPLEMYDEIDGYKDDLRSWLRTNKSSLLFAEEVDVGMVTHVTESGYASNLNEDELETVGKDPFLIAYALVDPEHRRVVTTEVSRPSATRANRKIPDVCKELQGFDSLTTFELIEALDFTTDWKR